MQIAWRGAQPQDVIDSQISMRDRAAETRFFRAQLEAEEAGRNRPDVLDAIEQEMIRRGLIRD